MKKFPWYRSLHVFNVPEAKEVCPFNAIVLQTSWNNYYFQENREICSVLCIAFQIYEWNGFNEIHAFMEFNVIKVFCFAGNYI